LSEGFGNCAVGAKGTDQRVKLSAGLVDRGADPTEVGTHRGCLRVREGLSTTPGLVGHLEPLPACRTSGEIAAHLVYRFRAAKRGIGVGKGALIELREIDGVSGLHRLERLRRVLQPTIDAGEYTGYLGMRSRHERNRTRREAHPKEALT